MKILKVNIGDIKVRPSKKKFDEAGKLLNNIKESSGLPKEEPIEKNIYYHSEADIFEAVKQRINMSIDKMNSGK